MCVCMCFPLLSLANASLEIRNHLKLWTNAKDKFGPDDSIKRLVHDQGGSRLRFAQGP